jgi:hypothetical protein
LNDSFEERRRKRLDRRVGLPGAHDLAHMTWRIADSFNPMTARSASIGFPPALRSRFVSAWMSDVSLQYLVTM